VVSSALGCATLVRVSTDDKWYWDLNRKMAVHASERGSFDHVLGPYATKAEAEDWQRHVEERNEAWDEADEEWEQAGEDEPPTASG
jgi:hypothetical protein